MEKGNKNIFKMPIFELTFYVYKKCIRIIFKAINFNMLFFFPAKSDAFLVLI